MSEDNNRQSTSVFTGQTAVAVDAFGKRRKWARLDLWEWSFLVVSTLNITLCIILSILRLVNVVEDDANSPDFIFTIVLIVNSVFCGIYVVHGLLKELKYEIYMFVCAATFVLAYCIVEYCVNRSRRTDIKLVRLILGCIFGPINIALAVKVAREFGWLEFRILGASQQMQRMYQQAVLLCSLLKFDLQAAVSFVILVLKHGINLNTQDIVILSIGLPFCVLWMLLGRAVVRREWRCGAVLLALLGLVVPVYVLYSIVILYLDDSLKGQSFLPLVSSRYIVGGVCLLVRGAIYIELYAVYKNFGQGLRERAFDDVANERTGLLAR